MKILCVLLPHFALRCELARRPDAGHNTVVTYAAGSQRRLLDHSPELDGLRPDMPLELKGPLYVSLDMDVLDPAYAPGVSHHEPGGMATRDVLKLIQSIECPVVGADIVEYNPDRDVNEMTAAVAAKFLKELAGIMLRQNT